MAALADVKIICYAEYIVQLCCIRYDLNSPHNVETRIHCPPIFCYVHSKSMDDVSESKRTFWDGKGLYYKTHSYDGRLMCLTYAV